VQTDSGLSAVQCQQLKYRVISEQQPLLLLRK
jgi:hypothetical protein